MLYKPRMVRPRQLLPILILALLPACSTLSSLNPFSSSGSSSSDKVLDYSKMSPQQIYSDGISELNAGNDGKAVTLFDAVEQYYPYSTWVANAQLMHGFAEYQQGNYTDATAALERYIQLHPAARDIAYAYYLRALCYYEQIEDISRDQKATVLAMNALQEVVNRFPDSSYARDARLKIDLCRDHLAGKEMEIGRYYEKQHLYIAAIGRYRQVVENYQTTNHVAEALERLVECYLALGLPDQARRYAAVLGHNYPGSSWYADSWDALVADGDMRGKEIGPRPQRGLFGSVWHSVF